MTAGKRRDPEATRTEILEAALRLSRKSGVESLSLERVAKEAGVSYFAVHYHFGKRDRRISEAAIEYVGAEAQKWIGNYLETEAARSSNSRVQAYIEGTFAWAKARPHHAGIWLYFYYLCSCNTRYRSVNRTFLEQARRRIERLLAEDAGMRLVPPVPDSEELAGRIHSQLIGGVTSMLTNPGKDAHKMHLAGTKRAITDLILQSAAARG